MVKKDWYHEFCKKNNRKLKQLASERRKLEKQIKPIVRKINKLDLRIKDIKSQQRHMDIYLFGDR